MKVLVVLLWAGCLLSIAGAVFRLVWLAAPWERLLVLALAGGAVLCSRRPAPRGEKPPL